MNRTLVLALAAGGALAAAALGAQLPTPRRETPVTLAQDPGMTAIRNQWRGVTRYIARSAELMTEADYAYKPVATVRTFGQLVAHVAGAQNQICAAALGDPPRKEEEFEQQLKTRGMSKTALIAALKASTDYCEKAYAQSGLSAAGTTDLFGDKVTRFDALALNAVHNGEHYGNIITYLRLKGLVPPSSQQ